MQTKGKPWFVQYLEQTLPKGFEVQSTKKDLPNLRLDVTLALSSGCEVTMPLGQQLQTVFGAKNISWTNGARSAVVTITGFILPLTADQ